MRITGAVSGSERIRSSKYPYEEITMKKECFMRHRWGLSVRKVFLGTCLAGFFLVWNAEGDAAEPYLEFDFSPDSYLPGKGFSPLGSGRKNYVRATEEDVRTGALICRSGAKYEHRLNFGKFRERSASIKINFKLDRLPEKQKSLFCYYESSWGVQMLGVYLTPEKKARIRFAGKKEIPEKKMDLLSSVLPLRPGQEHCLIVCLNSGSSGKVYLDGKLVLSEESVLGFSDFTVPPGDRWHPYSSLGSTMERNKCEQNLEGIITGFGLYKGELRPQPQGKGSISDVNLVMMPVKTAFRIDGIADEKCYESAEWTLPFSVLGKENSEINGLWELADDKFVKHASRAALFFDDQFLYCTIRAPYPPGMKPQIRGAELFRDDCVEFFLQPGTNRIYQILVNSIGKFEAHKYDAASLMQLDWQPSGIEAAAATRGNCFTVEIRIPFSNLGVSSPENGSLWRGNFAREGETCGGLSSWAPVGSRFLAPGGFGKLIAGNRTAYFVSEQAKLAEEAGAAGMRNCRHHNGSPPPGRGGEIPPQRRAGHLAD